MESSLNTDYELHLRCNENVLCCVMFELNLKVSKLSLGVLICHDLDIFKKLLLTIESSRRSRSLDQDREILIMSQNNLPIKKVLIEIEIYQDLPKVLIFFLDLDWELVDFSFLLDRDFSVGRDFWAWSPSKRLDNVEISR